MPTYKCKQLLSFANVLLISQLLLINCRNEHFHGYNAVTGDEIPKNKPLKHDLTPINQPSNWECRS